MRRMTPRTLYQKIWDAHVVRELGDGAALLYVDRHLVHEVTSPQAFDGLRRAGRRPWRDAVSVIMDLCLSDRQEGEGRKSACRGNWGHPLSILMDARGAPASQPR